MKNLVTILALLGFSSALGQSVTIRGRIVDSQRQPIPFANVALFRASDTLTMIRGTASDLEGRYSNETIPTSIVRHRTDYAIRSKDHALGLSLSWRFGVGRKKAAVRPQLENFDNDSGLFKIK